MFLFTQSTSDEIQYTKSHGDINPKAITPLGPCPNVEEIETGFQTDFSELPLGGVEFSSVMEAANKIAGPRDALNGHEAANTISKA